MRSNFEAMKKAKRYDSDELKARWERKNKEKGKRQARRDSYDSKRLSVFENHSEDYYEETY